MRWALLGLALLLALAGLLYRGSVAFVSSLSDAVDRPATVAATPARVAAPTAPDVGPAGPVMAARAPAPPNPVVPEPAPQPDARPDLEDPTAREQRVLRSRRALETVDPREFVRQQASQ